MIVGEQKDDVGCVANNKEDNEKNASTSVKCTMDCR